MMLYGPEYGPTVREALAGLREMASLYKHDLACPMNGHGCYLMGVSYKNKSAGCACWARDRYELLQRLNRIFDDPEEED